MHSLLECSEWGFREREINYEDDETALAVGSNTSALRYTRISPISPPKAESTAPPCSSTGANSRKMNEMSPRMMYSA